MQEEETFHTFHCVSISRHINLPVHTQGTANVRYLPQTVFASDAVLVQFYLMPFRRPRDVYVKANKADKLCAKNLREQVSLQGGFKRVQALPTAEFHWERVPEGQGSAAGSGDGEETQV